MWSQHQSACDCVYIIEIAVDEGATCFYTQTGTSPVPTSTHAQEPVKQKACYLRWLLSLRGKEKGPQTKKHSLYIFK